MTQPPAPAPRGADAILPWIVALLCLAGVAYVGAGLSSLQSSVQSLIQQELNVPTELKSEWRWQGILMTVTTHQREGESTEDFTARHAATLAAALATFPKDP